MAAGALGTLTLPRPRLDLAITSSLSIRGGELGLGFGPLPKFSALLRVSRRPQKVQSVASAVNPKDDRRSTVSCELQETATEVPDVTKETWQSHVMECEGPVVVEFWAPWCRPCWKIHPVVTKLAKVYEGKLEFFKINTDECPDLASQYEVRSIPVIMLFKNGEKKGAVIGAVPESTLVSCIDKFLVR